MTTPRRDLMGMLGLGYQLYLLGTLSVVVLVVLVASGLTSSTGELEAIQNRANATARNHGLPEVPVGIRQIWKPALNITDRCVSCHLVMDGRASPVHDVMVRPHPPLPHDPRALGCTLCHGGQGRATSRDAAHGDVKFWDEPMLRAADLEAGCGTCHAHVRLPARALAERGQQVVKEQECVLCHGAARPLDGMGLRGFSPNWSTAHVGLVEGEMSFAPLMEEDIPAVNAWLQTQVRMPRLVAGKMLAQELGCRGCHRLGGVGGDEGPDLARAGLKPAGELVFTGVQGNHDLSTWHREHLLDPGRVAPGSLMPNPHLTDAQAQSLTVYLLSQRERPMPQAWTPLETLTVTRMGEREFPTDGESLFKAFCVGCHGTGGQGLRSVTPPLNGLAIGSPGFLALADDRFIRRTINEGRPGRPMPGWGTKAAGLRVREVDAVVTYLRSLQPAAPAFEDVMAAPLEGGPGKALFTSVCASCHGPDGDGTVLGPPLSAPDNPVTGNPSAIYGTLAQGVAGTAMGSFRTLDRVTLRSVVEFVRTLPRNPDRVRTSWKASRGSVIPGKALFEKHCASCHGKHGEGGDGPALANPAFQAAASDGMLVATMVRGRARPEKAMPAFGLGGVDFARLESTEVADLLAFLRTWAPAPPHAVTAQAPTQP